jgi:hypothetical protein
LNEQVIIDKATDFIYENAPFKNKDKLRARIQKHLSYKTCRIFIDSANMVYAVCLWNIVDSGKVAFITEMTIRKDYRKKDIMRKILIDGMKIWPVKYLMFDRENEDGSIRGRKLWSTKRFLRRKA